ncbi:MAG: His/Gly/Thr/Pro-type tRNA ligase C-terminal domain-containing protein, partial [Armatimonadota bacterium]
TADVFAVILAPGEAGERLLSELRSAGIRVLCDPDRRSAKSQFRQADKSGAPFAVTLGEDEIARETARVKRMETGEETEVPLAALAAWLLERLPKG